MNYEKHSKLKFDYYEDFFAYNLYWKKRDEKINLDNNTQLCKIILNEDLNYINSSIFDYISSTINHPERIESLKSLINKLKK